MLSERRSVSSGGIVQENCAKIGPVQRNCVPYERKVMPMATYTFRLDRFHIDNTRSRHTDTDFVAIGLQVGDQTFPTQTQAMGDLNNGDYNVGLAFANVQIDEPTTPAIFNYQIVNAGNASQPEIIQKLETGVANLASQGATALGDKLAPGTGSIWGEVALKIVTWLGNLLFPDCDGPVAIDQIAVSADALDQAIGEDASGGTYSDTRFYPGVDSADGCGSNSQYTVTWSVDRVGPPLHTDESSSGRVAAAHQTNMNQLDCLLMDKSGALQVVWVVGEGQWQGPARLTNAGFAPPQASVALAHQGTMSQLDALLVDSGGALQVLWALGEGNWQGPARLTNPGFAPAGAPVAVAHQTTMNQLDAFVVDRSGALQVLWVVGGGKWQGPARLTNPSFAPPQASVAVAHQGTMNQLDALLVDGGGALQVLWALEEGQWQGPARLTNLGFAPPGAAVAVAHQGTMNQLDAFVVDSGGALQVLWVIGGGQWQGPVRLTSPGFAPPGAPMAVAHQGTLGQLDVLMVDNSGALQVLWVIGGGQWQGPVRLTNPGFAPAGAAVAVGHQTTTNQLDAFVVDSNGALQVLWVTGGGQWQGPARLTAP
jgi:hypothetical protein